MLKQVKRTLLTITRAAGVDALLSQSKWRNSRVLILCYHGISLEGEHEWNGELYMSPAFFARRLELLKKKHCTVLSLEDAMQRLVHGDLPPRSVVITFDDGMFDFHAKAMPLLKSFDFPATVYLTSFYATFQRPIFALGCSYLLWKHRERSLPPLPFTGEATDVSLSAAGNRGRIMNGVEKWVETRHPSAEEQYERLEELARALGTTAAELDDQRILHVMTPAEVAEVAGNGFDIQLHTHRHRTPVDAVLFAREIDQNRQLIQEWTGRAARHFCYPNGTVKPQFEPWLRGNDVISGVTCVPGLASATDNALHLPRLVDHSGLSEVEFESWLSGTGAWLRNLRP